MTNTYLEMEKKFGSIVSFCDGNLVIVALTEQAISENYLDTVRYYANAIDINGNRYKVAWDVVDGFENLQDETETCEWDSPAEVKLID